MCPTVHIRQEKTPCYTTYVIKYINMYVIWSTREDVGGDAWGVLLYHKYENQFYTWKWFAWNRSNKPIQDVPFYEHVFDAHHWLHPSLTNIPTGCLYLPVDVCVFLIVHQCSSTSTHPHQGETKYIHGVRHAHAQVVMWYLKGSHGQLIMTPLGSLELRQ